MYSLISFNSVLKVFFGDFFFEIPTFEGFFYVLTTRNGYCHLPQAFSLGMRVSFADVHIRP